VDLGGPDRVGFIGAARGVEAATEEFDLGQACRVAPGNFLLRRAELLHERVHSAEQLVSIAQAPFQRVSGHVAPPGGREPFEEGAAAAGVCHLERLLCAAEPPENLHQVGVGHLFVGDVAGSEEARAVTSPNPLERGDRPPAHRCRGVEPADCRERPRLQPERLRLHSVPALGEIPAGRAEPVEHRRRLATPVREASGDQRRLGARAAHAQSRGQCVSASEARVRLRLQSGLRRELGEEQQVAQFLEPRADLPVGAERRLRQLVRPLRRPERRLDLGFASHVGRGLDGQAQLPVDRRSLGVEGEGAGVLARLAIELAECLQVARLLLAEPLPLGKTQCTVQCRERHSRLAQRLVCGAELPQSVLLSSGVADRAVEPAGLPKGENRRFRVAHTDRQHTEVGERVPLDPLISQSTARHPHLVESPSRRLELPELGLHQSQIPGSGCDSLDVPARQRRRRRLAEELGGTRQAPFVPGQQAERVVGLEELGLEVPAAFELECLLAQGAGRGVVALAPGIESEPRERPRVGDGVVVRAAAIEGSGPDRARAVVLASQIDPLAEREKRVGMTGGHRVGSCGDGTEGWSGGGVSDVSRVWRQVAAQQQDRRRKQAPQRPGEDHGPVLNSWTPLVAHRPFERSASTYHR
jgi:hypothetical protein